MHDKEAVDRPPLCFSRLLRTFRYKKDSKKDTEDSARIRMVSTDRMFRCYLVLDRIKGGFSLSRPSMRRKIF